MRDQSSRAEQRAACARLSPSGTAFLVAPRLLACCAHSVAGKASVDLQFHNDTKQWQATVLGSEEVYDCALLELPEPPANVAPVVLCVADPPSGSSWRGFGFSDAVELTGTGLDGTVGESGLDVCDDKGRPAIHLNCVQAGSGTGALMPGYSGSPIFYGGEVCGFIRRYQYNKAEPSRAEQGLAWACPAIAIYKLAEKLGVTSQLASLAPDQLFFDLPNLVYNPKALEDARGLIHQGESFIIYGPRGFGKTSLCMHLGGYIRSAFHSTHRVVEFDLGFFAAEPSMLQSSDRFFRAIADHLAVKLDLSSEVVETTWRLPLLSAYRLRTLLEFILNGHLYGLRLVLSFDHLESVTNTEGGNGLLSSIRSWVLLRTAVNPPHTFMRLQVLLASAVEVDSQLQGTVTSPIGGMIRPLRLPKFELREVQALARKMKLNRTADELRWLNEWTRGHPALTSSVLKRATAQPHVSIEKLRDNPEFQEELRYLRKYYELDKFS